MEKEIGLTIRGAFIAEKITPRLANILTNKIITDNSDGIIIRAYCQGMGILSDDVLNLSALKRLLARCEYKLAISQADLSSLIVKECSDNGQLPSADNIEGELTKYEERSEDPLDIILQNVITLRPLILQLKSLCGSMKIKPVSKSEENESKENERKEIGQAIRAAFIADKISSYLAQNLDEKAIADSMEQSKDEHSLSAQIIVTSYCQCMGTAAHSNFNLFALKKLLDECGYKISMSKDELASLIAKTCKQLGQSTPELDIEGELSKYAERSEDPLELLAQNVIMLRPLILKLKELDPIHADNQDQFHELQERLLEFENRVLLICKNKAANFTDDIINNMRDMIKTYMDSFMDTIYNGAISSFIKTIHNLPVEAFDKIKYICDKWSAIAQAQKINDQLFQEFKNDLEEFTAANPNCSDDGLTFVWLFDEKIWKPQFNKYADKARSLSVKLQNLIDSKANKGLSTHELHYYHKAEEIIKKHSSTLKRKRAQLLYHDDYGVLDTQKWDEEIQYFFKNVLVPSMGAENLSRALIDSISILMGSALNDDSPQPLLEQSHEKPTEPTPIEFESRCSDILKKQGWETRLTKSTGDQGVDIVAERNGITLVFQCKLYNSPVGNKAVQEVHAGKDFFRADLGIVVSNAEFTPSARELAASLKVILLHHSQLEEIDRVLIINAQRKT